MDLPKSLLQRMHWQRATPSGALKRVALRNDATGLALRGIAMAQLFACDATRINRHFHCMSVIGGVRTSNAHYEYFAF